VRLLSRSKGKVEKILRPLVNLLVRANIHPIALTFAGFVISLCAATAFLKGMLLWGGLLMLLSGVCDMLDGSLARATQRSTAFGAFWDSTVDRYSEIVVYSGLIFHFRQDVLMFLLLVALSGAAVSSYTRARAEGIGQECKVGFLERPERMLILALGAILGVQVLRGAAVFLAVFTHVTAFQRVHYVWRNAKNGPRWPTPEV